MSRSPRSNQIDFNHKPIKTGPRLEGVKSLMKSRHLSIYIVPTQDAHGSEYICSADARREYLTGFTGSAGTALVLIDQPQSYLFTDGRYFNQASKELDPSSWRLIKQGLEGQTTWQEVLVNSIAESRSEAKSNHQSSKQIQIGCDPTLVNVDEVEDLIHRLEPLDAQLVACSQNLVDLQWDKSRPPRPHQPIIQLDVRYTGRSTQEKVDELCRLLKSYTSSVQTVIGMVFSALDEIAWLLNLRGKDIVYNPVFFSYVWVGIEEGKEKVILFVEDHQLDRSIKDYLADQKIQIKAYDQIWDHLKQVKASSLDPQLKHRSTNYKVLVSSQTSWAIQTHLGGPSATVKIRSPIQDLKSIKNPIEIQGFRDCHIRDGAALVSYFAWLEDQLSNQNQSIPLNEYAGAVELEKLRQKFSPTHFKGSSFQTISSSGKNAAIIHYGPDKDRSDLIDKDKIYLCDSGGQYLNGTTDVTRTLHFGNPKLEEVRAFTRVLQGHICLDSMIFPEKTTGYILDAFARQYLWKDGMDYRHGTGHGVGHYLNVHEGPQGIGTRIGYNNVALKVGMVLSNEPGYYQDEAFGIRIESMMVVKKASTDHRFGDRDYLAFENLTCCPIQTKLIDKMLLDDQQINWVNNYHQSVLKKLSPLLKDDQRGLEWLRRGCQPI